MESPGSSSAAIDRRLDAAVRAQCSVKGATKRVQSRPVFHPSLQSVVICLRIEHNNHGAKRSRAPGHLRDQT
ncbi:hypothetical protein TCAP_00377 [Tolypocladium capitatum]|uniref:Uncharacterized protein n=1 Tax=Tolypocladium capitatum TaxID=45235 RepID=A0A2K3QQC4_9HYPO|nr:hypothetical protein TCAP_00377 [Tolypocladium capitatum]